MADGSYVMAQFGAIAQGESDLASAYARVQTITETLQSQLNSSLAQWSGSARDAYNVARAKWTAAEQNMQSVLASLHGVAGEAAVSYPATEAANAGQWA